MLQYYNMVNIDIKGFADASIDEFVCLFFSCFTPQVKFRAEIRFSDAKYFRSALTWVKFRKERHGAGGTTSSNRKTL